MREGVTSLEKSEYSAPPTTIVLFTLTTIYAEKKMLNFSKISLFRAWGAMQGRLSLFATAPNAPWTILEGIFIKVLILSFDI